MNSKSRTFLNTVVPYINGKQIFFRTLAFKHIPASKLVLPSGFFESYSEEFRSRRWWTAGYGAGQGVRKGALSAEWGGDARGEAHGKLEERNVPGDI